MLHVIPQQLGYVLARSYVPHHAPQIRRAGKPAIAFFNFGRNKEESDGETAEDALSEELEVKKLQAKKLALQAELAELEAETSEERAKRARPPSDPPPMPTSPPPSPAPATVSSSGAEAAGETVAQLCVLLQRMAEKQGLESSDALQRTVLSSWTAARRAQQGEMERLRRQIETAVKLQAEVPSLEGSFDQTRAQMMQRVEEAERSRTQGVDTMELWRLAENRTGSVAERQARARALTKACFKYLASFNAYDEEADALGEDGMVPVPGEGLVSVVGSQKRLRLLERHEAASCVEYRIFASTLADDDSLATVAGTPSLLSEVDVTGNMTGLLSRWAEGAFGDDEEWQEMMASEDMADVREEFDVEGSLAGWLEPLSEMLGRSTKPSLSAGALLDLDEVVARVTLFPLALASFTGRQGNVELLTVYYIARLLGRLNVNALAQCVPARPPLRLW